MVRLTRLRRWIVGLTAALVCLIVVAAVVLSTPWFKDWLRGFVVSRVAASINGELHVRRLSGSLVRDIRFEGVSIVQDGQPTLQAETLSARYDLIQLLLGRFALESVAVDRPHARIVQEQDGWNLAHLLRTRATGTDASPYAIDIRHLSVTDGEIVVARSNQSDEVLTDVTMDGRLSLASRDFTLEATRLAFIDARASLPVNLSATLAIRGDQVRVDPLALTTPGSHVTGEITYQTAGDHPSMEGRLTLDRLALSELAVHLPSSVPAGVVAAGQVSVSGGLDQLHGQWALTSNVGRSNGSGLIGLAAADWSIEATTQVEHLNLDRLTSRADLGHDITASVTVRGTISSQGFERSRFAFTMAADHLTIVGYRATAVQASGTVHEGTLHLDARGKAYDATVRVNGTVSHLDRKAGPTLQADGSVQHANFAHLPRSLGAPVLVTDVSGQYHATLAASEWSVRFVTGESRVAGATVAAGSVVSFATQGRGLRASATGTVQGLSADLLHLPVTRPTSFSGTIDVAGTLADRRGPLDLTRMEGRITADLTGSTIDGTALDLATIDASLSAGVLDVRRMALSGSDVNLTAQGRVALSDDSDAESDLQFSADASDLSVLSRYGVDAIRGATHIEGRIGGSPGEPTAAGTFTANRLSYGATVDALAVKGSFDASVPLRDLARAVVTLHTDGTYVTIRQNEIQRLSMTARYANDQIDVSGHVEQDVRSVDVDGTVLFGPSARELRLRRLTIAGPGAPWTLEATDPAVIRYAGNQIQIDGVTFTRGAERLEAGGRIDLAPESNSTDLRLHFAGVSVSDLYTLTTGTPRVTGTADGDVHVTGAFSTPTATASVAVRDGAVATVPFSTARADLNLRDRRIAIDARVEENDGGTLAITGSVPTADEAGPLDLDVRGEQVSLALAQAITTDVDRIQGHATVHAHVAGTLAAPSVRGDVLVANAALRVVPTGVTYRNVGASLTFDGDHISIGQFSLADDDGHTLMASGGGDVLAGGVVRSVDVHVTSDGIHVLKNELGTLELSVDARVEGDIREPKVTGRVEVERGLLQIDELLPRLTSGAQTLSAPVQDLALAPAPATGLFSGATIDLDLVLPSNVVVRGNNVRTSGTSVALGNVNLTLGGNLHLQKTAGETPVVVGQIEAVRGSYDFQGRRLDVVPGSTVTFRGTQPIDPALDVTAQREVAGVTVQVRATGTASRPRVLLSSQPPLDEADVLSLIVFNEPVNELVVSQQVDLLQRASDLALGAVATPLGQSLARAFALDLFEIRTPMAGTAGEINIGRQVNERLFVGVRQQFGQADATRLALEYQISEALRILTAVSQGADGTKRSRDREAAGVDLVYRIRY